LRATSLVAIALLATCTSGCLPHVLHGPRIEDGSSAQLSLTLGRNVQWEEDGGGNFRVVPGLYVGARTANAPDTTGPAVSIGVQVPALLLPLFVGEEGGVEAMLATSYIDVYAQPNRRPQPGGVELGVGALFSSITAAPYLQLGRFDGEGDGWYTTQQVMFTKELETGVMYMPSIAYRDHDAGAGLTANWTLSGAVGAAEEEVRWFVMLGGTFEIGPRPRRP